MLSLSPLAHSLQFNSPLSHVTVTDVRNDTSDLTTYTFTACNLGDLGSTASIAGVYGTDPHVRSPGRKAIVVIVHGEDSAQTFNVSSVTIGTVAGTERIDRGGGGAGTIINTAIYTWDTDSLQGITSTDIVVTWSEAVTSCAIGVLLVDNIGVFEVSATGSGASTGVMAAGTSALVFNTDNSVIIYGTSCKTGSGTEISSFTILGAANTTNPAYEPQFLYSNSNAEMDFAAAWTYIPTTSFAGQNFITNISWDGAGGGDYAMLVMR